MYHIYISHIYIYIYIIYNPPLLCLVGVDPHQAGLLVTFSWREDNPPPRFDEKTPPGGGDPPPEFDEKTPPGGGDPPP